MIQVYMDDSGSHDDAHNCVVGGYWGSVEAWRSFESAWKQILQAFERQEFKSNSFFRRRTDGSRVPPYKEWSNAKASVYSDALLSIIQQHKIFPFAAGVSGVEWKKQSTLNKYLAAGTDETRLQKSLFLALQRCVYRC